MGHKLRPYNHIIYIYIYINKVEEKKIIEKKLIPQLGFKKKYIGIYTAFIVFMINLANLEIKLSTFEFEFKFHSLSLMYLCVNEYTNLYNSGKRCRLQMKYRNILTKPKLQIHTHKSSLTTRRNLNFPEVNCLNLNSITKPMLSHKTCMSIYIYIYIYSKG